MEPNRIEAIGEDLLETSRTLKYVYSFVVGLPDNMHWRSDAGHIAEQRLRESVDLTDELQSGLAKGGYAFIEYSQAQALAKARVAEGNAAGAALKSLIQSVVDTQTVRFRSADPLQQWDDLSSITGPSDFVMEWPHTREIEQLRLEADGWRERAAAAYEDAIRIERKGRRAAVEGLRAAYCALPQFKIDAETSRQLVGEIPKAQEPGSELIDSDSEYIEGPPTPVPGSVSEGFPYDPNVSPTPGDYLSWHTWGLFLQGARQVRPDLDDAVPVYENYRSGTGAPMQIDYEEAYREDPYIRSAIDNEIRQAQKWAERIHESTGKTSFDITSNPNMPVQHRVAAMTENWQKTLGEHTIYGSAKVSIDGHQATMRMVINADDFYNFNGSGAADAASKVPDGDNGRFSVLGWAKGFPVHGELERTVTWQIGSIESPDRPQITSDDPPRYYDRKLRD